MSMDVAVEAGEDAKSEDELRADGGDDGSALGFAGEEAASRARSTLDALPGRVVFAGGAAVGSVVTLLVVLTLGVL